MSKQIHWCGCVTTNYKNRVIMPNVCDLHKHNEKVIWVLMQHKTKKLKIKGEQE
jgi:hypothetical protein